MDGRVTPGHGGLTSDNVFTEVAEMLRAALPLGSTRARPRVRVIELAICRFVACRGTFGDL